MSKSLKIQQHSAIMSPEVLRDFFEAYELHDDRGEGGVESLMDLPPEKIRKLAIRIRQNAEQESCSDKEYNDILNHKFEALLLLQHVSQDDLTGLFNKKSIEGKIRTSISNLKRIYDQGEDIRDVDKSALLIIDLDKFKPINDTYGHGVGDKVLKLVSKTLKTELREGDVAARIGGDEFALFLTGIGENKASQAQSRISKKINSLVLNIKHEGKSIPINIGASVGMSVLDINVTLKELSDNADKNMYEVKQNKGVERKLESL